MKRLIIPSVLLIVVIVLYQWGNRILERTLDSELPGLLTNALGIQVTIDPMTTRIPKLAVHTAKLVMGDPSNPALVATGVNISLDWSSLLRGEIRLHRGTGSTLMVNPTLWPGNDDPWPTDYSFIEPYLPNYLAVDSVRYVGPEGGAHTFNRSKWQRMSPAAQLQWQDTWDGQTSNVSVVLQSLPDLLQLNHLQLDATVSPSGEDTEKITATVDLQPGKSAGYTLTITATAASTKASFNTESGKAWALPSESNTRIDTLDVESLTTLIGKFRGTQDTQTASWLETKLPRLNWPDHKGKVSVAEIRWDDEVALHNSFDFTTGAQGVSIAALTSSGPGGILNASGGITSADNIWKVNAKVDIAATKSEQGLAAAYLESDWLWRKGSSTIQGQGDTWDALLNSLTGDIALAFDHRGTVTTPVSITATLDNRPGELALEDLDIKLAKGRVSGSATLTGKKQKRLSGKIRAENVNANFLIPDADPRAPAGLPIPEFLSAIPQLALDMDLDIEALSAGGIVISKATIALARTPEKGSVVVHALGATGGAIDLNLDAKMFPDKPSQVSLDAKLANFDFARLFQKSTGFLDTRTSGTINFQSQGSGLSQVFKAMRGKAKLDIELRRDGDWTRKANSQEQLAVSGDAALVTTETRITGLQITNLVADSVLQNLTGTVSMVEGRKPWLEANMTSSRLDLPNLPELQPQAATSDTDSDPMQAIKDLGDAKLSLTVDSLKLENATLTNAVAQVTTAPDSLTINRLDFSLDTGKLTSKGAINWQKEEAAFSLDARVNGLDIEKFLADLPEASAPLSGSITLSSKGSTLDSMLASLSGHIELTASGDSKEGQGGQIQMTG